MSDGLTAFERRRAENAKANNEILNSISKTSAKVFATKPATTKSKTTTKPKRVRSEPVKRDSPMPTRRSARVAGIESTTTELKRELDDDTLRYGLGESAEQAHKAKKLRISGDLSLSDMQVDGRWAAPSLSSLGIGAPTKVPVQPGVRTFVATDDEDADVNKDIHILRTELNALQLYDKFEVKDLKLTKERIYAMAFHPTEDKPLVFAGDKEGRLGIFDASQEVKTIDNDDDDDEEEQEEPQIIGFKPHARTITSVLVLDADPASVYTSSYDTTIRRLDIQAQKSVEVYAPADDADGDLAISCIDFSDPNTVFFSTLGGALGRHDIRTKAENAVVWSALHDGHKIGGFAVCPDTPHLIATASLDRTLKIWDMRKIVATTDDAGDKTEKPFLVGSDASRLSVSHASWGPGGHIATTSYDDFVRVYDIKTSLRKGETIDDFSPVKMPHNNQTGRWVTILKPQWQRSPRGLPVFVLGNMNRFVDVYAADGTQVAQLDGDGITAVPAVAQMHPTQRWVAGGNASGKLTLWL
ncbi:wd repeat-containing protein [Ophiostoma piceae UAMH 11346]|uniref:DNA damage-binding protein CMR1 n=1 Tax=Ophiostoma piceae (strain UAMH 11346) TaxID=1262450 RepID=S3CUJ0_OPHP1|nr:wd repeat-containing protein [Ophiostoma piceae UAMH 11346]